MTEHYCILARKIKSRIALVSLLTTIESILGLGYPIARTSSPERNRLRFKATLTRLRGLCTHGSGTGRWKSTPST